MISTLSRTRTTDKRFYGVVSGIVTDVEDDGQEGRVKVQFPWFDDQMETEWCRVRQFYAGGGFGAFFVPEVGTEVLVAFVHGDMRLPIVLGGLYNGNDKPPTYRTSSQDQKMIQTKGGHVLLLDDSNSQQRVRITTNGGHTVDCDDTGKKITVQTSGGQKMVLDDSSQQVTIQTGGSTIELDATGDITLTGVSVTLSAPSVSLGDAASHPVVWGDVLLTWLATHTHISSIPGTPCSPPVVPPPPAMLSLITKTG